MLTNRLASFALSSVLLLLVSTLTTLAADVKLSPEQQQAADKLRAKGASVLQIAADSDALAVNLALAGKSATDAELALVKALPKVQQLNAGGTAVTDAGLANLSGMSTLTHLHLDRTAVTDAGLAHLKGLDNLIYLNLYTTAVTDKGLDQLKGLKNLKRLYVWQTQVTDDGAKAIKTALPDVYVNRGIEQAAVAKADEKKPEDKKPDDKKDDKKPEDKKDAKPATPAPAAPAAAATEVKDAPAGTKPVNTVCPVSGKPVVADAPVFLFAGQAVGFCCENCPKAFKADPKKFADKIKADAKPAPVAAAVPAKPEEKKPEAKPAPVAAAPAPEKKDDKKDAPKTEPKPADPKPAAEAKPAQPKVVATAAPVKPATPATPAKPTPAADANLLKPTPQRSSWRLEQHAVAKGTMSTTEDAVVFTVTTTTDQPWHVQAFQSGLDLQAGKTYTLTFKAKAESNARSIGVQAGQDEDPWANLGLDEQPELAVDWKEYKFTFTVSDPKPNKKNRVGFVLGNAPGKVHIKDVILKAQ